MALNAVLVIGVLNILRARGRRGADIVGVRRNLCWHILDLRIVGGDRSIVLRAEPVRVREQTTSGPGAAIRSEVESLADYWSYSITGGAIFVRKLRSHDPSPVIELFTNHLGAEMVSGRL